MCATVSGCQTIQARRPAKLLCLESPELLMARGMFGKGIYFADCPLKSWRYCFPSTCLRDPWSGCSTLKGRRFETSPACRFGTCPVFHVQPCQHHIISDSWRQGDGQCASQAGCPTEKPDGHSTGHGTWTQMDKLDSLECTKPLPVHQDNWKGRLYPDVLGGLGQEAAGDINQKVVLSSILLFVPESV